MSFISVGYLFGFLPVVVGLYYILRRTRWANVVILAASYLFYAASAVWYLYPLIVTSLIDFVVGLRLARTDRPHRRRALLVLSLVANLGLLGFFKYAGWLEGGINAGLRDLGLHFALPVIAVSLPPGISFYTFQTMSYTIEVYRREMKPARNLVDYMAFVTFWPHLVAGPIMRAHNLLRQLEQIRPLVSADDVRYALMLIVWGLFKKTALADNFGHIVESVDNQLQHGNAFAGAGLLFGYAFAGQIYCDFSAYTDIARGSAKLIGVDLVRNFNTPYFSASPIEFWRRWHISLSTWLRDYLYIPLGGNRHGRWREYLNLMITMLLGGLWHGAGVLFIAWGAWHGAMLVLYRVFPVHERLEAALGRAGKALAIILTFNIIGFGWILFRATTATLAPLLGSIGKLAAGDLFLFGFYGRGVLFLGLITLLTDYLGYRRNEEFSDALRRFNPYLAGAVTAAIYFGIVLLAKRETTQFIYFQF